MDQTLVAGASRFRPFSGRRAPILLDDNSITRSHGRGGCAAVYLATPQAGDVPAAVKLGRVSGGTERCANATPQAGRAS
jgi:hypothetical protein